MKTIDVSQYVWYKYVGARKRTLAEVNPRFDFECVPNETVFGVREMRSGNYDVRDADDLKIQFKIDAKRVNLLIKASKPYKGKTVAAKVAKAGYELNLNGRYVYAFTYIVPGKEKISLHFVNTEAEFNDLAASYKAVPMQDYPLMLKLPTSYNMLTRVKNGKLFLYANVLDQVINSAKEVKILNSGYKLQNDSFEIPRYDPTLPKIKPLVLGHEAEFLASMQEAVERKHYSASFKAITPSSKLYSDGVLSLLSIHNGKKFEREAKDTAVRIKRHLGWRVDIKIQKTREGYLILRVVPVPAKVDAKQADYVWEMSDKVRLRTALYKARRGNALVAVEVLSVDAERGKFRVRTVRAAHLDKGTEFDTGMLYWMNDAPVKPTGSAQQMKDAMHDLFGKLPKGQRIFFAQVKNNNVAAKIVNFLDYDPVRVSIAYVSLNPDGSIPADAKEQHAVVADLFDKDGNKVL